MHSANHGVSHMWEPMASFISYIGVGEWVRGRPAWLVQRGCFAVFETAQQHPTLPLCAVMVLSNQVSLGPLELPGGVP